MSSSRGSETSDRSAALEELATSLSPVESGLQGALESAPKYFERIAKRWISRAEDPAQTLGLTEQLEQLSDLIAGFDGLDEVERVTRAQAALDVMQALLADAPSEPLLSEEDASDPDTVEAALSADDDTEKETTGDLVNEAFLLDDDDTDPGVRDRFDGLFVEEPTAEVLREAPVTGNNTKVSNDLDDLLELDADDFLAAEESDSGAADELEVLLAEDDDVLEAEEDDFLIEDGGEDELLLSVDDGDDDELVIDDLDAFLADDEGSDGESSEFDDVLLTDVDSLDDLLLTGPIEEFKGGKSGKRGRGRRNRRQDRREERQRKPRVQVKRIRYSHEDAAGRSLDALEIDPDTLENLKAAGISSIDTLLQRPPVGEEVVEPVRGAGRVEEAGRTAVGGRVRMRYDRLRPDGSRDTVVVLKGQGLTEVRWEGGSTPWAREYLKPGTRTVIVGTAQEKGEGFELVNPEIADDDGKHAVRLTSYGIPGVDDGAYRALLRQVLPKIEALTEPIPAPYGMPEEDAIELGKALVAVHAEGSKAEKARNRLAYDEALLANTGLLWERYQGKAERGLGHAALHGLGAQSMRTLEFDLTDEQQSAFEDIKRDLRSTRPMRRVLTGEVGAGKGMLAVLSAVLVAENKHQVLFLAPDQATAEQRFAFTEPLFRDMGIVARLCGPDMTPGQRDALKRGEVHVVFGSVDLLSAGLDFRRLGLVIAGERGQFGGTDALVSGLRNPRPDLLVITSTPLPTSVLIAAYPSFDLNVLTDEECVPVQTTVLGAEARMTAYGAAAEAVARGEQAVVVFPMSRGADVLDIPEAKNIVATLESTIFPKKRVCLFHGAMSREERFQVYRDFRFRRVDVLVATTHFEAGPVVPSAGVVIVEQAERVPLARLHRIRGHLGHSFYQPRCWLVTGEAPEEAAVDALGRFAGTNNGFEVANLELDLQGIGGLVDGEQAQIPEFQWLNLQDDLALIAKARRDAVALLQRDPSLRSAKNMEFNRYLQARWEGLFTTSCPLQAAGGDGGGGGGRRRRRRRRR